MGDILPFRPKRLSGFLPDPDHEHLPKSLCDAYKEVRAELAGLVPVRNLAEPIYDDRSPSEMNPQDVG